MYCFKDKDDPPHEVTLRPEMTPTLARMVLSLGGKILLPVKWFSVRRNSAQFCATLRNSLTAHLTATGAAVLAVGDGAARPQARALPVEHGHHRRAVGGGGGRGARAPAPQPRKARSSILLAPQFSSPRLHPPTAPTPAQLLAAIVTFFKKVGITSADVGIKINSRRVLSAILAMYGVTGDKFAEVCVIVDKLDKIGPDATVELLMASPGPALGDDAAKKIVQSLSLKSIKELSALTGDLGNDAVAELTTLFEVAEAYGFADWILFDASVVRGLAYYTGIVFEGFDRKGELRAICGGGRYDKLLSLYGSPTVVPACGFGFGDCVVMELLREKGVLPTLTPNLDFVVVAFNNEMRLHAVGLAAQLRGAGFAVDVLLAPKKHVDKAFSYADRVDGRRVVFVAPDEWAQKKVRVKDLRAPEDDPNKQVDLPVDGFVEALAAMGVRPN